MEQEKNILKTLPKSAERRFQHNKDTDWAGYINLAYDTRFGDKQDALWKVGAQYRRKERSNRYYSYIFNPADISQLLDGNGYEQFANVDWVCKTPYSQASQLNYDSKEHIGGVYAMATLSSALGELNVAYAPNILTRYTPCCSTSVTWGRWASRAIGTICRRLQ